MSERTANIKKLLEEWILCAKNAGDAAEKRDFELFSKYYRDGKRCFKEIGKILAILPFEEKENLKEEAENAAAFWKNVLERLPGWMESMQEEMEKVKHSKKKEAKVSGAYSSPGKQKTAVNLFIRAK